MLNERDANALGTPGDTVTHWGISRIHQREGKEKLERLEYADDGGVHLREWPIGILSVDEVRARWGAGTFKCHWLIVDEQAEAPSERRKSGGHGKTFTLDAELPTRIAAPPREAAMPNIAAPNGLSADSLLSVVTTMMALADKRADTMISAVTQLARGNVAPSAGDADLRAQLAEMKAKLEADEKRREMEQKHRDELAAKDREVADLKRKLEDAEREAERDASPKIEPGSPVLSQIGYGIANAAMAKPELVGALLEKVGPIASALFGGGNTAQPATQAPAGQAPPPNGVPAPRAMPRVVPPVAPPVRAAEPAGPPPVSSWVPIGNVGNANGAAPPVVEEKPAEPVVEAAG